ncbi:MAG: SIMPL domain-containing protein [Pikeienuella sp.]
MPRFLMFAAMCAAVLIAFMVPAQAADRTITVQGTGTASAAPDILTVTIGVEASGKNAAATMRDVNARAGAVLDVARSLGVASKDMQTGGVSLSPIYDHSQRQNNGAPREPKIIGYRAGNNVMIRLRDLDAAGEAVGALVEAGTNRLNGLSFGFADATSLMDDARRGAVADARRKAELFAKAAGETLGPVLSIQEHGGGSVRPMAMARSMDAMESAVPLERGENTVSASVSVVWALSD